MTSTPDKRPAEDDLVKRLMTDDDLGEVKEMLDRRIAAMDGTEKSEATR